MRLTLKGWTTFCLFFVILLSCSEKFNLKEKSFPQTRKFIRNVDCENESQEQQRRSMKQDEWRLVNYASYVNKVLLQWLKFHR